MVTTLVSPVFDFGSMTELPPLRPYQEEAIEQAHVGILDLWALLAAERAPPFAQLVALILPLRIHGERG